MRDVWQAVLWLFLLNCFAMAQQKPDGEPERLLGAVKGVRIESAGLSGDGKKVKEGKRAELATFSFDGNGNVLEASVNNRDGSFASKRISTYDEAGRKKEELRYQSKEEIDTKIVQVYDNAGRKIESQGFFNSGSSIGKSLYAYDQAGRLIEESYYKDGSLLIHQSIFRYDQVGRLSEKWTEFKNGEIEKVVHTYGADGSRAEHFHYKSKDVLGSKLIKVRNNKEKSSGMVYYKADSAAWKWLFKYDDKDNVTEEEFQSVYGAGKWTYNYEYDAQGNWIKQTASEWFLVSGTPTPTPSRVTYREISYYTEPYKSGQKAILEKQENNSGVFLPGAALIRQEPVYPQAAKSSRIRGSVIVEVYVDEIGDVTAAKALSGDSFLKEAAVEAARKWKFKPTLRDGLPVPVKGTLTFNFNI
jgi:TonB family protein